MPDLSQTFQKSLGGFIVSLSLSVSLEVYQGIKKCVRVSQLSGSLRVVKGKPGISEPLTFKRHSKPLKLSVSFGVSKEI